MTDIVRILVDSEEVKDFTKVIEEDDKVYIAESELELGDKVTILYDEDEEEYNEAVFLSVDHPNVYKNLAIETEIEFVKRLRVAEKNFEIIVRAINRRDKTYVADEYYAFGIQDSYFYLAKVAFHSEADNSYAYKILLNLNNDKEDVPKYFTQLSEEDRKNLFLTTEELIVENKYKLRCEIIEDIASFRIKNTSKIESMETVYPWITIFQNININQEREELSIRNDKLNVIVGITEPIKKIDAAGMYGFAVPNSQVKIYRYEIIPLDKNISIDYYDNISYSKNVSTDFSSFYKNNRIFKLNSSDSTKELRDSIKEYVDVKDNSVIIDETIKATDVVKIQVNEITQEKDIHYEDKFVDVKVPMTVEHNRSVLTAVVDDEVNDRWGQTEEYFEFEGYTDGLAETFTLSEDILQKLKYYPNAKVGDILIEVNEDIVLNSFDSVGLQENLNKFYTFERLEKEYNGTSFFMETFFRGEKKFFEIGPLGNGRFSFGIDKYFVNANDSYNAVWNYNLANFLDAITDYYSNITTITETEYLDVEFASSTEIPLISIDISGALGVTIGYAMATIDPEDIEIIADKTKDQIEYTFDVYDPKIDQDIKTMMLKGVLPESIKAVLLFFQNLNFPEFIPLFLSAIKKDKTFESEMQKVTEKYGGEGIQNTYVSFRQNWIRDLDYNSHITTNSTQERNFYTSINEKAYSINYDTGEVVFNQKLEPNKKIALRIFYDNVAVLTDNYSIDDQYYFVNSGIKTLHEITKNEKGVIDVVEMYDPEQYKIIIHNNVPFVIVPKSLNENDGPLYADIELCSPYVEGNENVKRLVKAPLKKVSVFLQNDFENSIVGEIFEYTASDQVLQISGSPLYNRETDFIDLDLEFKTGINTKRQFVNGESIIQTSIFYYNYDYPRYYALPEDAIKENYFSGESLVFPNQFFYDLLTTSVVDDDVIDQYLDVAKWFNIGETKLGPYYKEVLRAIINIKSYNRYYTDKVEVSEYQNPFVLGNWFDGFYSGNRTKWRVAFPNDNRDFGIYEGNPWGTQNSRKQMIEQIRNTMDGKFPLYELYYVDLTEILNYQNYATDGLDASYIDLSIYPDRKSKQFIIDNPYIDPRVKDYKFNQTVYDEDGVIVFEPNSFINFTDDIYEYPEEGRQAYGIFNRINYEIRNIVRPINNGIDMYWQFDAGILFGSRQNNILPLGTKVNAEFEYVKKEISAEDNSPNRIIQKVNLGTADGTDFAKFPNPNIKYSKNVADCKVHRVWLDNYPVNQYEVSLIENTSRIDLTMPDYKTTKDIAVLFKASNYFDLSVANLFKDTFDVIKPRDFNWLVLTRDNKGYLKKKTNFLGYLADSEKIPGENVLHLAPVTDKLVAGGTNKSADLIRPIRVGTQDEDVVAIMSLRRNNNFEVSVDVHFDETIQREDMKTDLIFRGKFNNIDGKQYFNEFYSITLNLGDTAIGLVSRKYDEKGNRQDQLLAKIDDELTVIKRGVFYTLKVKLINDSVMVFFNERRQEEKFYFSYNLREGHDVVGIEAVAESNVGGLNVTYQTPSFYVDGNRIGLRSQNEGVNFSNFRLVALEENNQTLEHGLEVKNYDSIVSSLKKIYGIDGRFEKFKRTNNGYEYLLIGSSLFYRRNGETFTLHRMVVEDFEVIGELVYVRERMLEGSEFNIINVYKGFMVLDSTVIVDGKQFVNEPLLSYLVDTQRVVSHIEEIDGRLFIITEGSGYFVTTWDDFGDLVWVEVTAPWNLYG